MPRPLPSHATQLTLHPIPAPVVGGPQSSGTILFFGLCLKTPLRHMPGHQILAIECLSVLGLAPAEGPGFLLPGEVNQSQRNSPCLRPYQRLLTQTTHLLGSQGYTNVHHGKLVIQGCWKEPVKMAQEFHYDVSWAPPFGDGLGMPNWKETPGKTQNQVERLYFGAWAWEYLMLAQKELENVCLCCCHCDPMLVKWKIMDG